jgi:hypothetical protein
MRALAAQSTENRDATSEKEGLAKQVAELRVPLTVAVSKRRDYPEFQAT